METEGTQQIGCLRKTWWDCVKGDIERFGPNHEYIKDHWRLKIKGEGATPG